MACRADRLGPSGRPPLPHRSPFRPQVDASAAKAQRLGGGADCPVSLEQVEEYESFKKGFKRAVRGWQGGWAGGARCGDGWLVGGSGAAAPRAPHRLLPPALPPSAHPPAGARQHRPRWAVPGGPGAGLAAGGVSETRRLGRRRCAARLSPPPPTSAHLALACPLPTCPAPQVLHPGRASGRGLRAQ